MEGIRLMIGGQRFDEGRFKEALDLFVQVALEDDFVEFLTVPASELID